MKISRAKLIENVDAAIARREKASIDQYEKQTAEYNKALKTWQDTTRVELLETLRALVEKARKGRVVSRNDLSSLGGYDSRLYFDRQEPVKPDFSAPSELTALREFLDNITDDEIGSTTLRDVGFKDIARLLR